MNRRELLLAALIAGSTPILAAAQTPVASPAQDNLSSVDSRARDLAGLLQTISPAELVHALQTTPAAGELFGEAEVTPWVDFGDTDLHSSLGGAVILTGEGDMNDPASTMLGAYIVYESAEIAYHEFVRKLGSAYDIPSTTLSIAGTTVWELGTENLTIGAARIGYVMLLTNMSQPAAPAAMEALVDHLTFVAARLDA